MYPAHCHWEFDFNLAVCAFDSVAVVALTVDLHQMGPPTRVQTQQSDNSGYQNLGLAKSL